MFELHDWTLQSVQYDWRSARAIIKFEGHNASADLIAESVGDLHIPQAREWGPSVSVNDVSGPVDAGNGLKKLAIEMQSGDVITVVAVSFRLEKA